MSQLGTILSKTQLHNIVPAANEAVTMAEAGTGQAVGRRAKNKFMQTDGFGDWYLGCLCYLT